MTESAIDIKRFDDTAVEYEPVKHLYSDICGMEVGYLDNHVTYDGWRGLAAVSGGDIVGFIWGYHSAAGQWFHDRAEDGFSSEVYETWIRDSFELAEFGVHPNCRGQGIGTRLHESLISEITTPRAVTVTDTENTQARQYYNSQGWEIIRDSVTFTGSRKVLLGLELR